jgi:hypothetical protein
MNRIFRIHRGRAANLFLHGVVAAALLFSTASDCRTALGAETKLVPALEFREEFTDNVDNATSNKKNDFFSTINPSLAFFRSTDRTNLELFSSFSWRTYARSDSTSDSTDYQCRAQLNQNLSERYDLGLNAAYTRSTGNDTINQTTGLSTRSGLDRQAYSGNLKRVLDEKTTATLSYSFSMDTYDTSADSNVNSSNQDLTAHKAGLLVSRDLGALMPHLKGTFSTTYDRAMYQYSTIDNYTARVGASRQLFEKTDLSLSAGGRFDHSTFMRPQLLSGSVSEESSDGWGWVGSAILNYNGEKTSGTLSVSHDFNPASGQTGAVETTSFGGTLRHGFSDRFAAGIAAAYNINLASKGQFSARSTNDRALNLTADMSYRMSDYCSAGIQYTYQLATENFTDSQTTQNRVMLRISTNYPVKL